MAEARLYFRFSTMNAGKSTRALQEQHSYYEEGLKALLLVPAIDDRYGKGIVTSRIGLQHDAMVIDDNNNIYDLISVYNEAIKIDLIIVDEAQFLKASHVDQLSDIVDDFGIPVVCYGLRTDFQTKLFEGSKRLFEIADVVEEITETICWCKSKAVVNARLENGRVVKEGEQVKIGGNESYRKLCRKHYKEGNLGG